MESNTDEVDWMLVLNSVDTRLKNSSLLHKLVHRRKLKRSTKVLNETLKRINKIISYSQYVKWKTAVLRNIQNDSDTDDCDNFTDEDFKKIHESHEALKKYFIDRSMSHIDLCSDDSDSDLSLPDAAGDLSLSWQAVDQRDISVNERRNVSLKKSVKHPRSKSKKSKSNVAPRKNISKVKDRSETSPHDKINNGRLKKVLNTSENNQVDSTNDNSSNNIPEAFIEGDVERNELNKTQADPTVETVTRNNSSVKKECKSTVKKNSQNVMTKMKTETNTAKEHSEQGVSKSNKIEATENVKKNLMGVFNNFSLISGTGYPKPANSDVDGSINMSKSQLNISDLNPLGISTPLQTHTKSSKVVASINGMNHGKDSGIDEDSKEPNIDNATALDKHDDIKKEEDCNKSHNSFSNDEDNFSDTSTVILRKEEIEGEESDVLQNSGNTVIMNHSSETLKVDKQDDELHRQKSQPKITCTEIINQKYTIVVAKKHNSPAKSIQENNEDMDLGKNIQNHLEEEMDLDNDIKNKQEEEMESDNPNKITIANNKTKSEQCKSLKAITDSDSSEDKSLRKTQAVSKTVVSKENNDEDSNVAPKSDDESLDEIMSESSKKKLQELKRLNITDDSDSSEDESLCKTQAVSKTVVSKEKNDEDSNVAPKSDDDNPDELTSATSKRRLKERKKLKVIVDSNTNEDKDFCKSQAVSDTTLSKENSVNETKEESSHNDPKVEDDNPDEMMSEISKKKVQQLKRLNLAADFSSSDEETFCKSQRVSDSVVSKKHKANENKCEKSYFASELDDESLDELISTTSKRKLKKPKKLKVIADSNTNSNKDKDFCKSQAVSDTALSKENSVNETEEENSHKDPKSDDDNPDEMMSEISKKKVQQLKRLNLAADFSSSDEETFCKSQRVSDSVVSKKHNANENKCEKSYFASELDDESLDELISTTSKRKLKKPKKLKVIADSNTNSNKDKDFCKSQAVSDTALSKENSVNETKEENSHKDPKSDDDNPDDDNPDEMMPEISKKKVQQLKRLNLADDFSSSDEEIFSKSQSSNSKVPQRNTNEESDEENKTVHSKTSSIRNTTLTSSVEEQNSEADTVESLEAMDSELLNTNDVEDSRPLESDKEVEVSVKPKSKFSQNKHNTKQHTEKDKRSETTESTTVRQSDISLHQTLKPILSKKRPHNLQEYTKETGLILDEGPTSFSYKDIEDTDVYIIDIPQMMLNEISSEKRIVLTENTLVLGEHEYKAKYNKIDTITCIFGTNKPNKPYKAIKVRPTAVVATRGRINTDVSRNETSEKLHDSSYSEIAKAQSYKRKHSPTGSVKRKKQKHKESVSPEASLVRPKKRNRMIIYSDDSLT